MTGLKTKCQAGRPDWEEVLGQIHKSSPHKVRPGIKNMLLLILLLSSGDLILLWGSPSSRHHSTNM